MNGNLLSLSEFGKRLFDLRVRAGYKVPKELALVLCGYSKNTVGLLGDEAKAVDRLRRNIENWELGKNFPRTTMLARLCNLLDCDPDHLLYEKAKHPRKEIRDTAEIVGLSEKATESLIGMHKYGPTKTNITLNLLLENEEMWKWFAANKPAEDRIEGINIFWHISQYVFSQVDPHVFLVKDNSNSKYPLEKIEISANNYITHGEPLRALMDRAHIETVNDKLKQIRELFNRQYG